MSGYGAEASGEDFPLQEGVNFLTKPFPADKLVKAVRQCLDGRPSPDDIQAWTLTSVLIA